MADVAENKNNKNFGDHFQVIKLQNKKFKRIKMREIFFLNLTN